MYSMAEEHIRYNVLYMEDDPVGAGADLSQVEEKLPVRVILVTSLAGAQEALQTGRFDLFLLDIEIPGERSTGIQLAEQIRRTPAYGITPIIFTSMHTHYSHWLFSTIRHCSFLPKPFTAETLIREMGVALGLPAYLKQEYVAPPLLISFSGGPALEIDPLAVSYIEVNNRQLFVQYVNGQSVEVRCHSGTFKSILDQIGANRITNLRQIYRSILINVNQIKTVETDKNTAAVRLFNESRVFPMGTRYRDNLKEFT